jgi:hypothetical protein
MRCQLDNCTNEAEVEYQPVEAGDTESWIGLKWPRDKWLPVCEEHLKQRRIYWIRHPDGRQELVRPKS